MRKLSELLKGLQNTDPYYALITSYLAEDLFSEDSQNASGDMPLELQIVLDNLTFILEKTKKAVLIAIANNASEAVISMLREELKLHSRINDAINEYTSDDELIRNQSLQYYLNQEFPDYFALHIHSMLNSKQNTWFKDTKKYMQILRYVPQSAINLRIVIESIFSQLTFNANPSLKILLDDLIECLELYDLSIVNVLAPLLAANLIIGGENSIEPQRDELIADYLSSLLYTLNTTGRPYQQGILQLKLGLITLHAIDEQSDSELQEEQSDSEQQEEQPRSEQQNETKNAADILNSELPTKLHLSFLNWFYAGLAGIFVGLAAAALVMLIGMAICGIASPFGLAVAVAAGSVGAFITVAATAVTGLCLGLAVTAYSAYVFADEHKPRTTGAPSFFDTPVRVYDTCENKKRHDLGEYKGWTTG